MNIEDILKARCDKNVARALTEAGYYRPSYKSIDKWLWREKGIRLTVPAPHYCYDPIPHVDYYEVHVQYIDLNGVKQEHSMTGIDGTPDGAYRDACLSVLLMLTQKPPRLSWWQRALRRIGLLGETEDERYYRESVWPLQYTTPPQITWDEFVKDIKKMKKQKIKEGGV